MREISTIELAAIIQELKPLEGFYIEKFYELTNESFRIKLNKSGSGQANLLFVPGKFLGITKYIEQTDEPTNFSQAMRKRISNFHISKIYMLNDDRIAAISMEKGDMKQSLIIEMFGKGNILLVDESMKIILAYKRHEFHDRSVMHGAIYSPPKNKDITLSNISGHYAIASKINDAIQARPEAYITSVLASEINIGALYIENAVMMSGLQPKSPASEATPQHLQKIEEILFSYSKFVEHPDPCIFFEGAEKRDYAICDIEKYAKLEKKRFGHVYETLEEFYHEDNAEPKIVENKKLKELELSIEKQRNIITATEKEIMLYKDAAGKIFENMNAINAMVSAASELKRFTKEDLEREFPDLKIKDIDLKDKTITIEI